jgi:hypothetical protein
MESHTILLLKLLGFTFIVLGLMLYAVAFVGYLPGLLACCLPKSYLDSPLADYVENFEPSSNGDSTSTPLEQVLAKFHSQHAPLLHPDPDTLILEKSKIYNQATLTQTMAKDASAFINEILFKSSPVPIYVVEIIAMYELQYTGGITVRTIVANVHALHVFTSNVIALHHSMPNNGYACEILQDKEDRGKIIGIEDAWLSNNTLV